MNTRTAKQIRRGIEEARYGSSPILHLPNSALGRALKHERATLLGMNKLLTGDERTDYQGRIMAGMFGFMNEDVRQSILETEGKYRRLARKAAGYKK
jgi:hypothetical protein